MENKTDKGKMIYVRQVHVHLCDMTASLHINYHTVYDLNRKPGEEEKPKTHWFKLSSFTLERLRRLAEEGKVKMTFGHVRVAEGFYPKPEDLMLRFTSADRIDRGEK
jgi:hypothetical protein